MTDLAQLRALFEGEVIARPGYGDTLSAMSRDTLAWQGGPFSTDECHAFETLPYAEAAITLRLLDDAGKELRTPESCFADYLGLLNNLMGRGWDAILEE